MQVLRSEAVLARVDPSHGLEVLDLVELGAGRQLLGRPPFGSERPRAGDLDEEPWTAAWRGGWQGCFPNAGNACTVGGVRHGFHGRASNDPWEVIEADHASVLGRWEGHGLLAERRLTAGDGLTVETTVEGREEDAPLLALEHLAFGLELVEPAVELDLPDGTAWELDEQLGPASPPENARSWPLIGLTGGGSERGERWQLEQERGRVYVVSGVAEGRAAARNPARGHGVELSWSAEALPHLVVWHEARATGGVWRHATEVLCLEPCSVFHLLGLEAALDAGHARRLARGERFTWTMTVRPN